MNLEVRLSKLEREMGPARGFVILIGEEETNAQAIAAAGIDPTEQDLVILLRKGGTIDLSKRRLIDQLPVPT